MYVGEKGGKFSSIAEKSGLFDECRYIWAGKLRRYHKQSLIIRLIDVKTNLLNIRDVMRLTVGTVQSIFLFKKIQAHSVLLKGGYVCVPASIGAKLSGATIITHDSDALPGLSNRIAGKYARYHATAMPPQYYNYPKKSIRPVGLPIDTLFKEYSNDEIRFLKEKFDIPTDAHVVLVTGGSNGARRLNAWAFTALNALFSKYDDLFGIIIAGKGNIDQFEKADLSPEYRHRFIVIEFTSEMYHLTAMADVILSRAGATTIAEFASQSKACVIVPNPELTGGHQLKNAQVYEDQESVVVVQEKQLHEDAQTLVQALDRLIMDANLRRRLGTNLKATLPKMPAAQTLAQLLMGEDSVV